MMVSKDINLPVLAILIILFGAIFVTDVWAQEISPFALTEDADSISLSICMMKEYSRNLNIASPVEILTFEGTGLNSYAMAHAIRDTILYCHVANGLMVYDISDVTSPLLLHSIYLGYVAHHTNIVLHENYLLVPRYDRMIVFDVSDPANPAEFGEIFVGRIIGDFECLGNRLYLGIAALYGDPVDLPKLYIYDITDPASAQVIGKYESIGNYHDLRRLTVVGDYVYGLDYWKNQLEIISIANETNPTGVGLRPIGGGDPMSVVCHDGFLYAGTSTGNLYRFDISEPGNPVIIDTLDVRRIWSLGIKDSVLYVNGYEDIVAVDITPPGTYDTLGIYGPSTTIGMGKLCLYDTLLVNPRGRMFSIISIADPTNLTSLQEYTFDVDELQHLDIDGDYAYFTNWVGSTPNRRGLYTVDISDLTSPFLTHWNEITLGAPSHIKINDSYVYVCNWNETSVYQLTDPEHPEFFGYYAEGYSPDDNLRDPHDFAFRGSYAFIPNDLGFDIADFSSPPDYVTISQFNSEEGSFVPDNVLLYGDYAFVTGYQYNVGKQLYLATFDISDLQNPELVYQMNLEWSDDLFDDRPGFMEIYGQYLFISDGTLGLKIVDISNPEAPDIAATYEPIIGGHVTDWPVAGGHLTDFVIRRGYLVLTGVFCFEVLDIADPLNPQLVQFIESPIQPWSVETKGDFLIPASRWGLNIFRFNLPPVACGDANTDGEINIGDAVFLISYVFLGGAAPDPIEAGDANADGDVNVGDAVYLINYVFSGGPEPCSQ